jgi:UDP-N-acetylmuramoyl-L-alanyl-D-glutamate--2,6-diaminopimelate ligase
VGNGAVVPRGVTLDSRRVAAGDLYAALPGSHAHGADFVAEAAARGAVGVLTDPAGEQRALASGLPLLVAPRPRAVLGSISSAVYGYPDRDLVLLGVTGTQGKTTSTRLVEGAWLGMGVRAGVIGTLGTRVGGVDVPSALTTPEASDLHRLFATMRDDHVTHCAMEVSSHALVMGRVDGVVFDIVAFTNLGRDHLDFHADLEDYYQAKAGLFVPERARRAIVSIDDEHGRRLARSAQIPVTTVSLSDASADWYVTGIAARPFGSIFTVVGPDGHGVPASVPLPGRFNVSNALVALVAMTQLGAPLEVAVSALARAPGIPGRLERVDAGQGFLAVVDYAHKPDALEALLTSVQDGTSGRVILVLGAGGDRDRGKRPIMGEVAGRLADVVIVTDDNPRSEDPGAIRSELLAGIASIRPAEEIADRRLAIRRAVELASEGDVVVVAGKGHEAGQEIAGVVTPFDDRVVLREELQRR